MTEAVTFSTPPTGSEAPAASGNNPASAPERPAWLPQDFKGTADEYVASLTKSQTDTKAELTRAQQELATLKKPAEGTPAPAAKDDNEPQPDADAPPKKEGELDVPEAITNAVDLAPYSDEFNSTGDVTVENRAKIADALKGVLGDNSATIVNEYIDNAKARQVNAQSQIKAIAGGDEGYAAMVQWGAANMKPEEKTAFNKAVNSGDFHTASFAVNGLKAKYEAANGKLPTLVNGDNSPSGNAQGGFASIYAMVEAQKDPRYGKDPDYTKQVEARAARSNF